MPSLKPGSGVSPTRLYQSKDVQVSPLRSGGLWGGGPSPRQGVGGRAGQSSVQMGGTSASLRYGHRPTPGTVNSKQGGSGLSLAQASPAPGSTCPPPRASLVHVAPLLLPGLPSRTQSLSVATSLRKYVPDSFHLGKLQPLFSSPCNFIRLLSSAGRDLERSLQGTVVRRRNIGNTRKSLCPVPSFPPQERIWDSVPSLFLQKDVFL